MKFVPPETLVVRDDAAVILTDAGYPIASTTLATKASRGGGPPYRLYGRKPLYRVSDLLAWAESRCSKIVTSTSEYEAA